MHGMHGIQKLRNITQGIDYSHSGSILKEVN